MGIFKKVGSSIKKVGAPALRILANSITAPARSLVDVANGDKPMPRIGNAESKFESKVLNFTDGIGKVSLAAIPIAVGMSGGSKAFASGGANKAITGVISNPVGGAAKVGTLVSKVAESQGVKPMVIEVGKSDVVSDLANLQSVQDKVVGQLLPKVLGHAPKPTDVIRKVQEIAEDTNVVEVADVIEKTQETIEDVANRELGVGSTSTVPTESKTVGEKVVEVVKNHGGKITVGLSIAGLAWNLISKAVNKKTW